MPHFLNIRVPIEQTMVVKVPSWNYIMTSYGSLKTREFVHYVNGAQCGFRHCRPQSFTYSVEKPIWNTVTGYLVDRKLSHATWNEGEG